MKGFENIEISVRYLLEGLKEMYGIDIGDVNFKDTPTRVAKAYAEICQGAYNTEAEIQKVLQKSFPAEKYSQMVLCKNIKTYGLCPHHLLPVEYIINIGYIPQNTVLGISKLARLANICARQPLMQETVTQNIGMYLNKIAPKGTMIVVDGIHYCMRMRGINQSNTNVITSFVSGVFETQDTAKQEFLKLIKE